MGVISAVEHIFNEATTSNRLAKANSASHGSSKSKGERQQWKIQKENAQEPKVRTNVPKAYTRATHRKLVSKVLKIRSEASSDIQESTQTCYSWNCEQVQKHKNCMDDPQTILTQTILGVMMVGMMNEMVTGVPLEGTNVVNKRMTLPQAHFHLEVWM